MQVPQGVPSAEALRVRQDFAADLPVADLLALLVQVAGQSVQVFRLGLAWVILSGLGLEYAALLE